MTLFDVDGETGGVHDGVTPPTWTVAELSEAVAAALKVAFPAELWVHGEIQSLSRSSAGHAYFQLVDPTNLGQHTEASINVALFDATRRGVNAQLRRSGGIRMTDGMAIRLRGEVVYRAPQGRVQLRMTDIDPEYTLGKMAAEREALLRRLAAEGLLDRNATVPLPAAPLRVGLVTSDGSAACVDFLGELEASGYGWQVTVVDARVQGPAAERSLLAALSTAARSGVDIVALVRGGGSQTDLAAFESEVLARAVANTAVPVLTGIGHEVDDSVVDRVAHTAYKTPTACAAGLVAVVRAYDDRVQRATTGIGHLGRLCVDRAEQASRVGARGVARVALGALALADRTTAEVAGRLHYRAPRTLDEAERGVEALAAQARAFDPARALARGWSITTDSGGGVVRSVHTLAAGERLVTRVSDGEIASRVTEVLRGAQGNGSDVG